MSLTSEQFNKLVTKEEHNELKEKVFSMDDKIDKIIDTLDFIVKKYEDHDSEHVANIGAHDRMQTEIDECRRKLNLKTAPAFSR